MAHGDGDGDGEAAAPGPERTTPLRAEKANTGTETPKIVALTNTDIVHGVRSIRLFSQSLSLNTSYFIHKIQDEGWAFSPNFFAGGRLAASSTTPAPGGARMAMAMAMAMARQGGGASAGTNYARWRACGWIS